MSNNILDMVLEENRTLRRDVDRLRYYLTDLRKRTTIDDLKIFRENGGSLDVLGIKAINEEMSDKGKILRIVISG